MTGYGVAWLVAGSCGLVLACLIFVATRRWRRLRYLLAGFVLVWSLTPYRFDGEHDAPAFAVATFRLFLEEGLDPRPPLTTLVIVSAALLTAYLVALGAWSLLAARRRR